MSMNRGEEVVFRIRKRFADLGVLKDGAQVGVFSTFTDPAELQPRDNKGQRLLRIKATTSDVDLVDEVIDPDGADKTYIDANRKIFLDHRYDTEYVVGALRYTVREGNGHAQLVSLMRGLSAPYADDVWIIANEVGIGASIGFDVQEINEYEKGDPVEWKGSAGIIRKWRWLETSLTCFPCNVACQTMQTYTDDTRAAKLDAMVTKSVIRRETAAALGYAPARPKMVIRMVG